MKDVKVNKSVITSIRTDCEFDTKCLTEHTEEMNERMERNILINENKIAMGLKRAQGIQTR
jgi:hypothetical protein